jgi:hypothetical protein
VGEVDEPVARGPVEHVDDLGPGEPGCGVDQRTGGRRHGHDAPGVDVDRPEVARPVDQPVDPAAPLHRPGHAHLHRPGPDAGEPPPRARRHVGDGSVGAGLQHRGEERLVEGGRVPGQPPDGRAEALERAAGRQGAPRLAAHAQGGELVAGDEAELRRGALGDGPEVEDVGCHGRTAKHAAVTFWPFSRSGLPSG